MADRLLVPVPKMNAGFNLVSCTRADLAIRVAQVLLVISLCEYQRSLKLSCMIQTSCISLTNITRTKFNLCSTLLTLLNSKDHVKGL